MGGTWQAKAGVGPMKGGGCHKKIVKLGKKINFMPKLFPDSESLKN